MKNAIGLLVSIVVVSFFISCQKEKKSDTNSVTNSNEISSNKATDTLKWVTELCEMNSEFDASKYTKRQLQDTYKLWFSTNGYIDFKGYPVFELDEKIMPIENLETTYSQRKKEIENLEIVDLLYWKNIKKLKLEELKSYYDYEKNAVIAYNNPAILIQTNYDPKAEIYVDALASGDSLKMINAWKKLNEEQKKANTTPDYVEKKFQNRLNSNKSLAYAKMELFSFGWSNNIKKIPSECDILNRIDLLENEYEKLFITTKRTCDEP